MSLRFAFFGLVLLATACTVGPDYVAPDRVLDEAFIHAVGDDTALSPESWWQALNDETLVALLDKAINHSPSLDAARADLDAALAARRLARSAFWPDLTLNASYTEFEQSLRAPNAIGALVNAGLVERDGEFYTSALETRWELDLWGGIRRDNQRAMAELSAAGGLLHARELAELAETAAAYFEFLGSTARMQQLEKNLDLLRESEHLTRQRQRIGLGREIDALRASVALSATSARLPGLKVAQKASLYRLAVLTGQTPVEISASVKPGALPEPLLNLSAGTPADLLQRRPDIAVAERQLAAATASIGVAQSRFFPTLALNGSFGFEAIGASDIGTGAARNTALVPFIRWPVFAGGRVRAEVASANARASAAAARYEQAVLNALAETETALLDYQGSLESAGQLRHASASAAKAATIARKLYQNGLLDYLSVLDAERTLTDVEDQYVVAKTQSLLALVRLYKTLGGGWANDVTPGQVGAPAQP